MLVNVLTLPQSQKYTFSWKNVNHYLLLNESVAFKMLCFFNKFLINSNCERQIVTIIFKLRDLKKSATKNIPAYL